MHIEHLILRHFRNLADFDGALHPVINVVHGRNAQGKTNLLEAISVLATLKSFRGSRTGELVEWGQSEASVAATVMRRQVRRKMVMRIRDGSRVVHLDGKRARTLQESFGHVHAILFAPEDLAISKGSARGRRTFLDRAIFNVAPAYYEETRSFDQALRSRNALLRDAPARGPDPAMMAVFEAQLTQAGARVTRRRMEITQALEPLVAEVHEGLCAGQHRLAFAYESSVGAVLGDSDDAIADRYRAALQADRRRDVARKTTSRGPQVDDWALLLDDRPARQHASQGQHRSIVLALKLAELDHAERCLGERPVLLLDDVSSELDRDRNAQLLERLDASRGQVVVTTTDPAYLEHRGESLHFRVEDGTIRAS